MELQQGGQQDPQPQPGMGHCCCPSSSYGPALPPLPLQATRLSQDSIPPGLGDAGAGRCGREASFPRIPAEQGGDVWGALASCSPPLPTPEVRTGFQAQVQTWWPGAAPRRTPQHRQTATRTALAGGQGSQLRELGDFWLPCFQSSSVPGQRSSTVATGTPPCQPCHAQQDEGRRQLSFPIPLPSLEPISSQHPHRDHAAFQLYSSF